MTRLIRFYAHDPLSLTVAEYEQIAREVAARFIVGDVTVGDRVLAAMLLDNELRYRELKREDSA